jgi:hypothetical protein
MYIAQRPVDGDLHFRISHSFKEGRWWRNADLVDLGPDPGRFILSSDREEGFAVEEGIRKELDGCGIRPGPGELEELFLPFAPAHLQGRSNRGQHGGRGRRQPRLRDSEKRRLEAEIALFDRRRLHHLVWGDFDLSAIGILPVEVFQSLADKSRDEIEQDLLRREQVLAPEEYNRYVFSIFNLQPFFIYLEIGAMPPGEERDGLDQFFIEELCLINASPWYWMQDEPPGVLHPHLSRYMVMFFDYDLAHGVSWHDFLRDGDRSPPAFAADDPTGEAEKLFGIGIGELRALSHHDLHSLYKKRALALHPDHGGDQGQFVRLKEVYEAMMKERG